MVPMFSLTIEVLECFKLELYTAKLPENTVYAIKIKNLFYVFHLLRSTCQQVYRAYLLRVHGRCAEGVDDYHVRPSVAVDEVPSVALPQAMHHTGLIEIEQ